MTQSPIPVICDSCRKTGTAGEGEFAHVDFLDFTPVPRQGMRVDGWSAERQVAFIAALATTGSTRRAAKALDMSPHGIVKLRQAKGADSFNIAFDRAMAIAARNGSLKVAQGVADAAARNGHEADDEASDMPEDEKLTLLENIFLKILRKVEAEREARLAGEVVAADFYLRQVTFCEVAFDMMAEGLGLSGWELLGDLRRGGHGILEIAETPMSRTLDTQRRALWKVMADPDRPEHPPERYLDVRDDHSLEPLEVLRGGEISHEEQKREFEERHKADAAAQVEWEASAQLVRGTSEHEAEAQVEHEASGHPRVSISDDEADRAMRHALRVAREAHPEDFDE